MVIYSNDYDLEFEINDCVFDSLFQIGNQIANLIQIEKSFGSVSFSNSVFRKTRNFDNLLHCQNIWRMLVFRFLVFNENEIVSQILNVQEALNISIENTICTFTNNKNGSLYQAGGGAFRLYNILYKRMINIEISHSFSTKTCFGIKIIDDSLRNISNRTNFSVFSHAFLFLTISIDSN